LPVLLVHGYSFGTGCPGYSTPAYWSGVTALMTASGWPVPTLIDFYQCDTGGVSVGSYTRDTPIDTLAAALDAYIGVAYGNRPVLLVGHSMGGLIIRAMLANIASGQPGFAPLTIPQAVTVSSPFDGATIADQPACGASVQCSQFAPDSTWLTRLRTNPDPVTAGGTDWTTIGGGPCDIVTYASATDMPGAHRIAWTNPCYSHTGILADDSLAFTGNASWENPNSATVYTSHNAEHSVAFILTALTSNSW
jgi:pimeloyl-ACP methyl ester carboxylesterase